MAGTRRVFRVGLAEAVYHLAVSANLLIFRSLVVADLGLGANGIYQSVLGVSRQYTSALLGGVFVYLYPRLSAAVGSGAASREIARAARFLLALAVPAGFLLLAWRDWLVRLVLTQEFGDAVPLFGISAPADSLFLLAGILRLSLLAAGEPGRYLRIGLLSEALYLIGFVAGLQMWGLTGAVAAYFGISLFMIPLYASALGEWAEDLRRGPLPWVAGAAVVAMAAYGFAPVGPVSWRVVGTIAAAIAIWLGIPHVRAATARS